MEELYSDIFHIRYVKLHFELTFPKDCRLPKFKASALRGGMGEMLLRANCIRDRKCEHCDFRNECIVQRTMYSRFENKPEFITSGDSVGYVLNCRNYEEFFEAGSSLRFSLTLFGSTIVYLNLYLQALSALGQNGLGKDGAHFYISQVTNTKDEPILEGNNIYMGRYQVETVGDYVHYRMNRLNTARQEYTMTFQTPLTQKHNGAFLKEFDMTAILRSIQRRLLILNAFEGEDAEAFYNQRLPIPKIESQVVRPISVMRYSNRRESKMPLNGIKGEIRLAEVNEKVLPLLLAGEVLHIGKNTSFGFGGYRIS